MLSASAHVWWVCSTTRAPVMRWIGAWNALRREFDDALAFERLAGFVEHDHVARARFRPMQAERQDR
jgi:hypothetical protein